MNNKFSIVTVTFNAQNVLEKTLISIKNQTYKNYELLIIDGGSQDETCNIINNYNSMIHWWVSEKDNGIYDAMNKGLKHSSGDWILFLNAGDCFYNEQVLDNINDYINNNYEVNPGLIYGNIKFIAENGTYKIVGKAIKSMSVYFEIPLCHQATLIKKLSFYQFGEYDTTYKIIADYVWFVKYITKGGTALYYPGNIAEYTEGGVSTNKILLLQIERLRFANNYYSTLLKILFNAYWILIYGKSFIFVKIKHTRIWSLYRHIKKYKTENK